MWSNIISKVLTLPDRRRSQNSYKWIIIQIFTEIKINWNNLKWTKRNNWNLKWKMKTIRTEKEKGDGKENENEDGNIK